MFLMTPKSTFCFFACCDINNVVIWVREIGGIMYHFQNLPLLVFIANSLQLALSIYQKFQLNANNCFIFWHVRESVFIEHRFLYIHSVQRHWMLLYLGMLTEKTVWKAYEAWILINFSVFTTNRSCLLVQTLLHFAGFNRQP